MTDQQEPSVSVAASNSSQSDRRRPGRIETVAPPLIPLLRDGNAPATDYEERRQDDLAPATGIAVSVLISGLIWAILIWIA
jgi:hypothetical protein